MGILEHKNIAGKTIQKTKENLFFEDVILMQKLF